MTRPWRLTRQAEESLTEIALWTYETFGPAQAEAYEAELLACCEGIAAGEAVTQGCDVLVPGAEGLRFARAGGHTVVFVERDGAVVVVDVVHQRMDLGRRVRELGR